MNMQEPEEQRLEEEQPMEPAEDVSEFSDEPVLSDSDASETDEAPASAISAEEEADEATVNEDANEELPPEAEAEVEEEQLGTMQTAGGDLSAWYVVHCYSGYENKVRHNLEQRIETMGMKDMIFDVVVPTQEEIEVKEGKRRTVERHIFPGYVLVNMTLTEESWYVVRNTPGVTGFVGMGNNPTPLRPEEVAQIVKRMEADAPTVKVTFKVGERVRIIDGPFNDFRGVVSEIDMERTKVRVMVSFFGRETPVELDFLQVEKA
jgi:transcription termination/antitermination protein NusG